MPPRPHHTRWFAREWLLDGGALIVAVLLLLIASTAFNRLPYPGAPRYARRVVPAFTVPVLQPLPDFVPLSAPDIDNGNADAEEALAVED